MHNYTASPFTSKCFDRMERRGHLRPQFYTLLRSIIGGFFLLAALTGYCPEATGADSGPLLTILVQETYTDNALYRGDWDLETRIAPKLGGFYQTESLAARIEYTPDLFKYIETTKFDTWNHLLELSTEYAVSDNLVFTTENSFTVDSTYTNLVTTTGLVVDQVDRYFLTFNPKLIYQLDELNSIEGSYSFGYTKYEDNEFSKLNLHDLQLTWNSDLKDEKTTLIFTGRSRFADYRKAEPENFEQSYSLTGGVEYEIGENFTVRADLGAEYTDSSFDSQLVINEDRNRTNWIGSFGLERETEKSNLVIDVGRDVIYTITTEHLIRNQLAVIYGYEIGSFWTLFLEGGYIHTETDNLVTDLDNDFYYGGAGIAYSLRENLVLSLQYDYSSTNDDIDGRSEGQNRVLLRLTWELFTHPDDDPTLIDRLRR